MPKNQMETKGKIVCLVRNFSHNKITAFEQANELVTKFKERPVSVLNFIHYFPSEIGRSSAKLLGAAMQGKGFGSVRLKAMKEIENVPISKELVEAKASKNGFHIVISNGIEMKDVFGVDLPRGGYHFFETSIETSTFI